MRCSAEYSRRKQRIDPLAEVSGESGSLSSADHAGIAAATIAAHPRRRATERSAATIRTPNEFIADLLSLRSGRTWQALDGTELAVRDPRFGSRRGRHGGGRIAATLSPAGSASARLQGLRSRASRTRSAKQQHK